MKKFVCSVCGYVYEGETAPDFCPICKAPKDKFVEQVGEMKLAAEHEFGIYAKTVKNNPDISAEDKKYIFDQLMATSTASAPRWACTCAWLAWPTGRAIPRSACTGRRPPMRRPSTPPSLLSCWARS